MPRPTRAPVWNSKRLIFIRALITLHLNTGYLYSITTLLHFVCYSRNKTYAEGKINQLSMAY